MKAIGKNVIVIVNESISNHISGDGLVMDGNDHNINNILVASSSDTLEKEEGIYAGSRIIVSRVGINKQNLIEIDGREYLRIKSDFIQARTIFSEISEDEQYLINKFSSY